MKKRFLCFFMAVFVLAVFFTVSISANQEIASGRGNTYQSLIPVNMEVQVNGSEFSMVSFGDVLSSLPLNYHESGYFDQWSNSVTSEKSVLVSDGGTSPIVNYTDVWLINDTTRIDDVLRSYVDQYFGSPPRYYDLSEYVYVNGIAYNQFYITNFPIFTLISVSGNDDLLIYEEPEVLPEGQAAYRIRIQGDWSHAQSVLGPFASIFEHQMYSSGGEVQDPVYDTKSFTVDFDNMLYRNNEGNGFRSTLTSTIDPSDNLLFYVDNFYQFRPTFTGSNFAMGFGGDVPRFGIGTKTARVEYYMQYAYIVKTELDTLFESDYRYEYRIAQSTFTDSNASGSIDIVPRVDQFFDPGQLGSGESVVMAGSDPAVFVLSYTTVISVRRCSLSDTFTLRNQYCESDLYSDQGYSSLHLWLAQFEFPLYNSPSGGSGGSGGIGGGSGGTGSSPWGAFGDFITASVGSFTESNIFGDFSIGDIMWFVLGIGCLFAVLKYFAGG